MTEHVTARAAVAEIPLPVRPAEAERDGPAPEGTLMLNANESRFGAAPGVAAALHREAEAALSGLYPPMMATPLNRALEACHGLRPGQVLSAAGGELMLPLALLAFAGAGDEVAYFGDGFMKFRGYILTSGAVPVAVERAPDAVATMLDAVTERTRIVLIDNPANPSGRMLSRQEIWRLRKGLPGDVLLMLDEAYIEFADPPRLGLDLLGTAEGAGNTMVMRTFSKAHGLAGLRVGWAAGPVALMEMLARVLPSFPVPRPSLAGALAALEDQGHLKAVVAEVRARRGETAQALRAAGWEVPEGQGNFVLVKGRGARDATGAIAALTAAGIEVRAVPRFEGVPAMRITIGTAPEMARVLAVLTA